MWLQEHDRCDRITPTLENLHWLSVSQRVVLMACKCIHGVAPPAYLSELCISATATSGRQIWHSASSRTLLVARPDYTVYHLHYEQQSCYRTPSYVHWRLTCSRLPCQAPLRRFTQFQRWIQMHRLCLTTGLNCITYSPFFLTVAMPVLWVIIMATKITRQTRPNKVWVSNYSINTSLTNAIVI